MKIKFQNINKKVLPKSFLKNKNILSIIKKSYDKDINDLCDEWKIYFNPYLFEKVVQESYLNIKEKIRDYDYLVSYGKNSIPLAYSIAIKYNKKTLFLDDEWGVTCFFQKIKPININLDNCRLLLVLPYFESGLKASRGIDVLNDIYKNVRVDVLTIVFFPEYIDRSIFEKKIYKNSFLYYLFHWNQEIKKQVL